MTDTTPASARIPRTSLYAASVLGLAIFFVGACVLTGWALRLPALTTLGPQLVSMKPNAALAFLLLGGGLFLRARSVPQKETASVLFGLSVLIGTLQLFQEITGLDLRIDQALFEDFPRPVDTIQPGRMAPMSAVWFVLLGSAGMLLHRGRRAFLVGQALNALAFLAAIHTLYGYAYDVKAMFHVKGTTAVALPSALAAVVLATGFLLAEPKLGAGRVLLSRSPSGTVTRRMVPLLLIAPMLLGWIGISFNRLAGFAVSVVTTGETALVIGVLGWTILAMRRGERALATATRKLEANERVFRSTFENAFVGMAHVSPEGYWLRVNDRLEEMLGNDSVLLAEQTLWESVHPRDRAELEDLFQKLTDGALAVAGCELQWQRSTGEWLWLSGQVSTLENAEGELQHFVLVLDDVTQERDYEEQLLIRTRSLESAGVAVLITDARAEDNPVVYVNHAFEELTGYEAAEVLGRNCRFLNQDARDQPELEVLRRAIAEGRACTVTLENHRKDGQPFWIELNITPVHDRSGRVTHFIGVQNDITERRRFAAERELLLHQALVERSKAEEAARARDVLLAIVSHELRSPLNSIRLWSTLLRTNAQTDPRLLTKAIDHIDSNVDLQGRLVNDLLDVSRISSGTLDLRREEVDLKSLVDSVVDEMRPRAADAKVTVTTASPDSRIVIDGDGQRLQQVVRNLFDNAIKFTPEGGTVDVSLELAGNEAALRVKDSGYGIDAAQISKVFDQFWQAEDRSNRRFRGLGLGLNIVRHIVERHAGRVAVESLGEGLGATFSVYLPVLEIDREETSDDATSAAAKRDASGPAGDILVVDDERATAEALALALMARGFAVRAVFDVPAARAAIAEKRPRIVISDLMMPGITGFDFMQGLRTEESREELPPVRSIAITGRGNPADRRLYRMAGFDAYMQKPISVEELVAWVRADGADDEARRLSCKVLICGAPGDLGPFLSGRGLDVRSITNPASTYEVVRQWQPDVVMADLDRAAALESVASLRHDFADLLVCGWTEDRNRLTGEEGLDFLFDAPIDPGEVARVLRLGS